jgi:hypothetical protein
LSCSLFIVFLVISFVIFKIEVKESHSEMVGGVHDMSPTGSAGQSASLGACYCHVPHESQDVRMWQFAPVILPPLEDAFRLCLNCHGYDDVQIDPPFIPGVDWGLLGTTPPQITNKSGDTFIHLNHETREFECTICHKHSKDFRCGGCHDFPPDTKAHYEHAMIYRFDCSTCHKDNMVDPVTGNPKSHPDNAANPTEILWENVDIRFDEKIYFPGGTTPLNGVTQSINTSPAIGSSSNISKSAMYDHTGSFVTCNIGCHNPINSFPKNLPKNVNNTVDWAGSLKAGRIDCVECHDDVEFKFNDTSSHSSYHPVNPTKTRDCMLCHDFLYPNEAEEIEEDLFIFHTNYKELEEGGPPPTWPQDTYVLLMNRDTYDPLYFKINVTEDGTGGYDYEGDPDTDNTDGMTAFCLDCHDGDDSDSGVFSIGGGAPNIERWTYWENSAHATGNHNGTKISCFGTVDRKGKALGLRKQEVSIGCHGNGHGSKKVKLVGPAHAAAVSPNYSTEEEGLCYDTCHNSGSGIENLSISGLKNPNGSYDGTPSTYPYFLWATNIKSDFGGSHHPVVNSENQAPYKLECTSCHAVHWANGKWWEIPNGKTPISRVGQIENAKTDQYSLDLLWGDEEGEKAKDYVEQYGGTGSEVNIFDPDGYCCGGGGKPAIYYKPKAWWEETDQIADTVTFCLDCHSTAARVRSNYTLSWGGNMHGGGNAGRPSAGGDSYKWWGGDAEHPNGCDRDAGISAHFIRNNADGYDIQATREKFIGVNFVLMCTDCHGAHGGDSSIWRQHANNGYNESTGEPNLSPAGSPTWNTSCNQCHYYYGAHHAGMSCGNASCHELNSIHKAKKLGSGGNQISIVWDGSDCSHPPDMEDRVKNGKVIDYNFNEGVGTKINNYFDITTECTTCGGSGTFSFDAHISRSVQWVQSTTPINTGMGDFAVKFDRPNTGEYGAVQMDYYEDPADGYPYKYGPVKNVQEINEFTVSAWIKPDQLTCAEGQQEALPGAGLNTVLRRDIITTQFWIKNWALVMFRYSDDGNEIGGACVEEDWNHDVLRFLVAVGDPNNMVYDYWCGTWPATVWPVDPPNFTQGGTKQNWDCIDGVPTKIDNGIRAFSFAQTKRAAHVDADPMDNTPVLRSGQWQHVMGIFDGKFLKICINGEEAAVTDMGGTGDYVVDVDPLLWGGTGVNRHVMSFFAVGTRPKWVTSGDPISGGGVFWNTYSDYDLTDTNFTYIGEVDDVKYYKKALDCDTTGCRDCHEEYPYDMGSHATHFTAMWGPRDQKYDAVLEDYINNCDQCHGADASYGNHIGHMNGIVNFPDGGTGTMTLFGLDELDPLEGTKTCDECHGVNDADNPDWRLEVKNHWRVNNSEAFFWQNDPGYCETCHSVPLSEIQTEVGTLDVLVTAPDAVGEGVGHITALGSLDCVGMCHDNTTEHMEPVSNLYRMIEDPVNKDNPFDPYDNDRVCIFYCHNGDGIYSNPAKYSTHSNIHNPDKGMFDKQQPCDFQLRCIECHNPHASTNLYMIREWIKVLPPVVDCAERDPTGPGIMREVEFIKQLGPNSYDESGEGEGNLDDTDDLCVVCHIQEEPPGSGIFVSTMVAHPGGNHAGGYIGLDFRDQYCMNCHKHNYDEAVRTLDGFMPRMHDRCLDCHREYGGKSIYDVDGQFSGIGGITTTRVKSQHLVRYVIDYGEYEGDRDKILLSNDDIECKKCHGDKKHPTANTRVVDVDDDEITYSTKKIPADNLDDFCMGCHDGVAGTGVVEDIKLSGVLLQHQLAPRFQDDVIPLWEPPVINESIYRTSGHGASVPLSEERVSAINYSCTDCHDYHGNSNFRLIKDKLGKDDNTYAYDGELYYTYDDWCSLTCHFNEEVSDHTGKAATDFPESGDSRDSVAQPTHPTSMYIPEPTFPEDPTDPNRFKIIDDIKSSIYLGNYLSPPEPAPEPHDDVLCVTCHDPHGTSPTDETDKQMVRMEWSSPEPEDEDLCTACHI